MRKLNIFAITLAFCLLLTGCQLARPDAQPQGEPVGLWLEMHKEGDVLPDGYAPSIDFESTDGAGLILVEKEIGADGLVSSVFGGRVSSALMDRHFGSHSDVKDNTVTTTSSSFGGTLYVDGNSGSTPEEVWVWYIYEGAEGNYYAGPERQDIFYLRQFSISPDEGAATYKLSYKTSGDPGQGSEAAYELTFKAIGKLTRVRILEFDAGFNRTSSVEIEINDEDEYQTKPDTAYVVIQETYVTNGQEKTYDTVYSKDAAIDYNGQMAQYHGCKYMGPGGLVQPRSVKILF